MIAPPLWARLTCGWCGTGFTADPGAVPTFPAGGESRAMCCSCWVLRAKAREQAGLPTEERPKAYPEDYEPGD